MASDPGTEPGPGCRKPPRVSPLNLLKIFLIFAAAGLAALWALHAAVALAANKKRLGRLEPLLAEADGLALHYDQALRAPAKYAGKPVLWCVQSRAAGEVYYRMDASRKVNVLNPGKLPLTGAGKQIGCRDMLFRLKGAGRSGPAGGAVDAEFLGVP